MNPSEANYTIRDEKREAVSNPDFMELAREKVERYGSTVEGLKLLLDSYARFFVKTKSLGIPRSKIEYYYEVVTAKADSIFKKTFQNRLPSMNLDELYLDPKVGELKLSGSSKYAVFGPKKNLRQVAFGSLQPASE